MEPSTVSEIIKLLLNLTHQVDKVSAKVDSIEDYLWRQKQLRAKPVEEIEEFDEPDEFDENDRLKRALITAPKQYARLKKALVTTDIYEIKALAEIPDWEIHYIKHVVDEVVSGAFIECDLSADKIVDLFYYLDIITDHAIEETDKFIVPRDIYANRFYSEYDIADGYFVILCAFAEKL
jgi:hypothetical protein